MPKIDSREKKIAWIISSFLGLAIIVTTFLTLWGKPLFDEYMVFATVVTIFPAAVLDYVDYRWRRSVDEHLPDLFRSIVQAQQAGMTLPRAVEEASQRNYGALTRELKKMAAQISWGTPFEKAFQSFGKRVNTQLTRQAVPLVIEASHSGGRINRVFQPLGKFVESTLTQEKARQNQTRPYVAIIYVAFFVFLFTVVILFKAFFAQMSSLPTARLTLLTPEGARTIFYHMSIIQAFFSGLIAGKMGEGTVSAGLKHSVILLTSGYLTLKFLI